MLSCHFRYYDSWFSSSPLKNVSFRSIDFKCVFLCYLFLTIFSFFVGIITHGFHFSSKNVSFRLIDFKYVFICLYSNKFIDQALCINLLLVYLINSILKSIFRFKIIFKFQNV